MDPLVSIIVRTCNRPDILQVALESIKKQKYENVETVIIEDGKNTSEEMIKKNFSELNFQYYSFGTHRGRATAGNKGMEIARGEYFCFLDDDDELFPDHIKILVDSARSREELVVYAVAEECQIRIKSRNPYRIEEKRKRIRYRQPFCRLLLFKENYLPIQTVLFSRKLYELEGGFDENLDCLEDWDLWIRYSLQTDFCFVDHVTSKYYVPFRSVKKVKRNREFAKSQKDLLNKFATYEVQSNVRQLSTEADILIKRAERKNAFYYLKALYELVWFWDI